MVGFLEHMMQANMSTRLIHCYLVDVDLRSRYEMLPVVRSFTNKAPIPMNVYLQRDVERLAFVTVYFLVLVIKVRLDALFLFVTDKVCSSSECVACRY